MSLLRTTMFRSPALRSVRAAPASASRIQARFATQDYGSGKGDPAGEKPQEQGTNPKSHLEHPGPEAPKVGGGGGGGSGGKSSSSQTEKSSGQGKAEGSNEGKGKPQPKILNESPPEKESESTRKHNEEMDQRHNRPHEQMGKK
ncbi:hypothetical protein K505DRAFT_321045 [Melanomma pulvis-pyrius CBS 109.77]|uniref:Uncharacterized protein n=1 Tax=Melanomma pulvis-pyrius CBS 109.77 TaxID=1314802 RepID=A0A6A6XTH7_9PLEO|nr:hypothetical protein K505DRAFT_321045 [Melanomma pulvis-pyrius CBS 109.77]